VPYVFADDVSIDNQAIKSLSRKMLENIELLLKKRPSLESLWNQWFFWRQIEGAERPIEPLIDAITPSPLSAQGTVPPGSALDQYFDECKTNGNWPKVIKILEEVWDREYTRVLRFQREDQDNRSPSPAQDKNSRISQSYERFFRAAGTRMGDNVGVPLMEAYLNDDKPHKANEIFNDWLATGNKFTDLSKVIELAKEKARIGS